jgi:hypothetical protein
MLFGCLIVVGCLMSVLAGESLLLLGAVECCEIAWDPIIAVQKQTIRARSIERFALRVVLISWLNFIATRITAPRIPSSMDARR